MKAMILSAGYGTRLKPYTDELPKALVHYRNTPMIHYQIERLKNAGADEIIINAHHFSDQLADHFLKTDFGVKCNVIVEKEILGTGGGIINAGDFLKDEECFIVINVDVETDMDLRRMMICHDSLDPLATIAVQDRVTFRYLKFDDDMKLLGRGSPNVDEKNLFAFNGVHIISGRIFNKGLKPVFEDIIKIYLDLTADKKEFVAGYDAGKSSFKDLGKLKNLLS
ncbi:MAG: sugar phosphate nucleotidyltransferase [Ignavibacteria bacterium]